MKFRVLSAAAALLVSVLALRPAAETATAKPEDVGLSSERLARITEMMKRHIAAGEISGGVTLVARHGKIAHFEATGVTDADAKTPMTKSSVFRIASMTKPVTGVAIMMMMEEGRLKITDPVSKYIPSFKDLKVAVAEPRGRGAAAANADAPQAVKYYRVPAQREITIRDLLTHVSGLASGNMSNDSARASDIRRAPTDTLADYIPRLGKSALEFQPGSRWAYSAQAGFDTLGRIVEITSGMPFDQFLRQRVFDPLGIKEASFYPTPELEPRLVTAYQLDPKQVYLMGFSQSAIISASVALTRPDKLAGVVAMSGRILPEVLALQAKPEALKDLPVMVVHGTADPVIPIRNGRSSRDLLSKLPVALTYREYCMGHSVSEESLRDIAAWLKEQLDSNPNSQNSKSQVDVSR